MCFSFKAIKLILICEYLKNFSLINQSKPYINYGHIYRQSVCNNNK